MTPDGAAKPMVNAAGGRPSSVRVSGPVVAANLISQVKAVYPASARAAGVQGSVLLDATIGVDGSIQSLRVMNTQVDPDLAAAAVDAVKQWRYQPTLLNGEPIAVDTSITVNFTLTQ